MQYMCCFLTYSCISGGIKFFSSSEFLLLREWFDCHNNEHLSFIPHLYDKHVHETIYVCMFDNTQKKKNTNFSIIKKKKEIGPSKNTSFINYLNFEEYRLNDDIGFVG